MGSVIAVSLGPGIGEEGAVGGVDVWEVESCTDVDAARGRSPQATLVARHRDVTSGEGILPAQGLHRFCELNWFPRFLFAGESPKRFRLYQVQGVTGVADGVYGDAPPEPEVKAIFIRWFGGLG